MNTTTSVLDLSRRARPSTTSGGADLPSIVAFYTATDGDYGAWSTGYNMHFGFHEGGMNPFDRESMLDRMNVKVVERLALRPGPTNVVDLGCGTGATARALLRVHPQTRVSAVTIVPAQVARGRMLNALDGSDRSIEFALRDYTDTGLDGSRYDGAYAIESSCHASGPDKRRLIDEAFRLLKPGGKLVIADCFIKDLRPLHPVLRWIYRRWCESWAVPEMSCVTAMRDAMASAGFTDVEFTDISWNVAPSVAHVPCVASRFLISEFIRTRGRISTWRRRHIVASWLSILLGLCRESFGYYLVSARKPAE